MDDLTNNLRTLGELSQADVDPVTARQVVDQHVASVVDLDAQHSVAVAPSGNKPRRRIVVGAAAAFVALVVGSAIFIDRQNEPSEVDTAVAAQSDNTETYAVPSNDNGWQQLRFCESTEIYDTDSGNTFYGAYQFTRETFKIAGESVGLATGKWSSPASAPPEIQDAMANQSYLDRGQDPWPICGRHIQGPMITPVIPQWIGQRSQGVETIVFIKPDVSNDRIDQIQGDLNDIFAQRIESSMTFVDKEAAYADFQRMNPEAAQNVTAADMPTSFRIDDVLSPVVLERVHRIDGVFDVVTADPQFTFETPPPMKLHIPAIGLQTPVFASTSLANLERGPAVLAGHAFAPVIAGYGSVEGSVFERLNELRPGDTIIVTILVTERDTQSEVVRTYEVYPLTIDPTPRPRALENLPRFANIDRLGLTLVSDVAGDPTQRLLIQTRIADPDLSSYGIGPTD